MQVEEIKTIHIPADQDTGITGRTRLLVNPDSISGEESLVIGHRLG